MGITSINILHSDTSYFQSFYLMQEELSEAKDDTSMGESGEQMEREGTNEQLADDSREENDCEEKEGKKVSYVDIHKVRCCLA